MPKKEFRATSDADNDSDNLSITLQFWTFFISLKCMLYYLGLSLFKMSIYVCSNSLNFDARRQRSNRAVC